MTDFSDRFEPSRYEHEQPDALWLDGQESEATTVPPFVFGRLIGIGSTYDMHYLTGLTFDDENRLNPTQCEGLLDEIDFVVALVDDALLRANVEPVRAIVSQCARSSTSRDLIIDIES